MSFHFLVGGTLPLPKGLAISWTKSWQRSCFLPPVILCIKLNMDVTSARRGAAACDRVLAPQEPTRKFIVLVLTSDITHDNKFFLCVVCVADL